MSKVEDKDALAAVSIKLPPYWPNDPFIWFAQVEAQFTTRGITTQETKFAYIIAALTPDIAQEVRDLLLAPPSTTPYDTLKAELIKRTSASQQKRLHQLLTAEELGDRKPSQLLRHMRQLLGENKLEDSILTQLFVQRLPANVQRILAPSQDTVKLEELATLADKILEVAPSFTPVSAVQFSAAATAPYSVQDEIAELRKMVAKLTTRVEELAQQSRSDGRGRPRGPNSSNSGNRYRQSRSPSAHKGSTQCWYHFYYGSKASKCVPPCTFSSKPQNQGNSNASN